MTDILSSSSTGTIFGSGATTLGLLAAAEGLRVDGAPGLSSRSRQLTQQYLSDMSSATNGLFSSTSSSAYMSMEDLQTQIFALRTSVPESKLAASLRGGTVDTEA